MDFLRDKVSNANSVWEGGKEMDQQEGSDMGKGRQSIEGIPLVQRHSGGLGHNSPGRLKYIACKPQNYPHLESRCLMRTDTLEMYWGKHLWMDWGVRGEQKLEGKTFRPHDSSDTWERSKERGPSRKSLRPQHGPEKTSARLIESPQVELPIEAGAGSCWHPYHAPSLAGSSPGRELSCLGT